jgi:hypothetical protein
MRSRRVTEDYCKRVLSYVFLLNQKYGVVNNPAPTESLYGIQCCGKEYGQLTNPPSPPWVTSFFLTFSISISVTCGTVFKTLYPKVAENEIEKVRKKDTFPAIRYKKQILFFSVICLSGTCGEFFI